MQNDFLFISFHNNAPGEHVGEDEKTFYDLVVEWSEQMDKEHEKSVRAYNRFWNVATVMLILLHILCLINFVYEIAKVV